MDKICQECKSREKPNGQHPQRGWCSNPKSPNVDGYIYKGDTCDEFTSKVKKRKKKEEK